MQEIEFNMDYAFSINNIPIRLTYERWYHITDNHDDVAGYYYDVLDTVENPDSILRANNGSLKAVKSLSKNKWLVVIYKEVSKQDGFVITAYIVNKKPKGEILWQQL